MRRQVLMAFAALIICTAGMQAQDQGYVPTPVTISKEKVKFGDKVYYSHVVLERQTLYSICKAYNVSLEDVYEANRDLELEQNGLKKNSIIRIPIRNEKTQEGKTIQETPANDGQEGQKQDIREGKTEVQESQNSEPQAIHKVKWYEDLDGIAAKYGVSKEAIMEANSLTKEKLKARMELVIPAAGSETKALTEKEREAALGDKQIEPEEKTDTTAVSPAGDDLAEEIIAPPTFKQNLNFALMLPFNAVSGKASTNYMDFYSGVLLAARNAKDAGVNIELSVYDAAVSLSGMSKDRLSSFDAIIGPVSKEHLETLLSKAPESLSVISPLDHKSTVLTKSHRNFFQANSDSKDQYIDLVNWIEEDMKSGDKVIVISEKSKLSIKSELDTLFSKKRINISSFSYNILEGRNIGTSMSSIMSKDHTNRIMIASESEAFVNDVIRNLCVSAHNKIDIVLYAPSKLKTFETIAIENFHNVNLHMSMSHNVDYDSAAVKDFVMKYRAFFATEPSAFAFQGYDITSYLADACSKYGTDWATYAVGQEHEMLQSNIRFVKSGMGYVNNSLRRVIYGPNSILEIVR